MKRVSIIFATLVVSACASPQPEFLQSANQDYSFDRSFSDTEEVEIALKPGVTVRSRNTQFNSYRRIEREIAINQRTKSYAPHPSLEALSVRAFMEIFPDTEFRIDRIQESGSFVYVRAQQTHQKVDIQNATATLRLLPNGEWVNLQSNFIDPKQVNGVELQTVSLIQEEKILPVDHIVLEKERVLYPEIIDGEVQIHDAERFGLFSQTHRTEMVLWASRKTGEALAFHNLSTHAEIKITGSILPNAPGDDPIQALFPFVRVRVGTGEPTILHADRRGVLSRAKLMGDAAHISLENTYFAVVNDGGKDNGGEVLVSSRNSSLDIDDISTIDERNIYYWLNVARQYLKEELNYHEMDQHNDRDGSDSRLVAIARHGYQMDNAFFNPMLYTLAFGTGNRHLKNTALSRDVVLHEYGHAYTHEVYGLQSSYEFRAMNEAFSDYLAATLTENTPIAEDAMVNRPYLRNLDNDMHWPDKMNGKYFHVDGQVFSGALWNLRETLGKEIADQLIHEARLAGATSVREFLRELLWIDEITYGDGNWATNSPHAEKIWGAFLEKGLHSQSRIQPKPAEDMTQPWSLKNHWGATIDKSAQTSLTR